MVGFIPLLFGVCLLVYPPRLALKELHSQPWHRPSRCLAASAVKMSPFSLDQLDQNPDSLAIELQTQAPDPEELEELGRTSS